MLFFWLSSRSATNVATSVVAAATSTSLATGPGIATHTGVHSSIVAIPSGVATNINDTSVNNTSANSNATGEIGEVATGGASSIGMHMLSGLGAVGVLVYSAWVGF